MLTAPLRSRFGLINRLDYYTQDELALIIERSAGLLDVGIERRPRDTPGRHEYGAVSSLGKATKPLKVSLAS